MYDSIISNFPKIILRYSKRQLNFKISLQEATSGKRHVPITFQSDGNNDVKRKKIGASPTSSSEQRFYKTPSGKFSGKVTNYSSNLKSRNNNRNGNNFRQRNNQGKNRNFRKY